MIVKKNGNKESYSTNPCLELKSILNICIAILATFIPPLK